MYAVILAGGGGTRLWPVSRRHSPKQVQPLLGEKTLLQASVERLLPDFDSSQIIIATNEDHAAAVQAQVLQIPAENIIMEPAKRDTAAAIGYAALWLTQRDPEAVFVTVNADAYVKNESEYRRVLQVADRVIQREPNRVVLIGVQPTYPETGYGYIKMGQSYAVLPHDGHPDQVFTVERFTEKPDVATATDYLSQWGYLWNPALFAWKAQRVLELFETHLPEHFAILQQMKACWDDKNRVTALFQTFPAISIDYGIIEKTPDMLVIPADLGWCDIGQWRTIKTVADPGIANVTKGTCVTESTDNSLLYNYSGKQLLATIGLKDMVVVVTDDVVLVCPQDKAQDVKKIVEQIKNKGLDAYL